MYYAFGKTLDFYDGEYGIGLLSKYKILHWQVVKLPLGSAEQRVALLAQVAVPGFDSALIIMVTHLDWQKDPPCAPNRRVTCWTWLSAMQRLILKIFRPPL